MGTFFREGVVSKVAVKILSIATVYYFEISFRFFGINFNPCANETGM